MSGLTISRKLTESITIGPDITITITKISGKRVHVQIVAPPEVKINRKQEQEEKRVD